MSASNKILQHISDRCNVLGWSLYKLSKQTDIPYSSLNNMFKRNTVPTVPTLEKICKGLNISVSDFFNDIETNNDNLSFVLSDEELQIIDDYRCLSKSKKKLLSAYMNGLLEKSNF